jgi:hypothetical protein
MINTGVFDPIEHKQMILNIVGLGDLFSSTDGYAQARSRQWRELKLMEQGQQAEIREGEDHVAHLFVIDKYINQKEDITPETMQLLKAHRDGHLQLQVLELQKKQLFLANAQVEIQNVVAAKSIQGGGAQSGGAQSGDRGRSTSSGSSSIRSSGNSSGNGRPARQQRSGR